MVDIQVVTYSNTSTSQPCNTRFSRIERTKKPSNKLHNEHLVYKNTLENDEIGKMQSKQCFEESNAIN